MLYLISFSNVPLVQNWSHLLRGDYLQHFSPQLIHRTFDGMWASAIPFCLPGPVWWPLHFAACNACVQVQECMATGFAIMWPSFMSFLMFWHELALLISDCSAGSSQIFHLPTPVTDENIFLVKTISGRLILKESFDRYPVHPEHHIMVKIMLVCQLIHQIMCHLRTWHQWQKSWMTTEA